VKIVIGKDSLLESLQRVFNIIPQKPTLPVLSNFLLKAFSDRLNISGTDMDISITTSTECNVIEEGDVTVNAKRFIGVIRELPAGDIEITVDNDRVTVDFENGQSRIMGMPSSDYPVLKDSIDGVDVGLSGNDFVEMVEKTTFSVSQDRTRLALTGIFWKVTRDEMVMVATDGHRLSLFRRGISVETKGKSEVIVPPKTLNQAAQLISGGAEINKIVVGENAILFLFNNTTIFSKLIEGPYPDFMQVIPMNNSKKVYISSEELNNAVRRVSVLSNSITHQIRISVTSGKMELATKNEDIGGESRESIGVRYDGEPMTAGYNATFLAEILRRIETDEVLLELEAPTTACIVKPVGQKETDEYIYLIMPLRLSD
jgi:DNA polymerase-3 subunit beta